MTTFIIQIVAGLIALFVGLKLPDIDLAPLFWRHRSAWTHGPWWALIVPLIPLPWWGAYVPLALLTGITLHLFADARPKAWMGSALINIAPIPYTFKPWMSFLYILGSCLFTGWTVWGMM